MNHHNPTARSKTGQHKPATIPIANDATPAHSVEAELCTLGAMLSNPATIDAVRAIVDPSDFFRNEHQIVMRHILRIHDDDGVPDIVTVAESLKQSGENKKVGEYDLLGHTLHDAVAASFSWIAADSAVQFAKIVRENADLRHAAAIGERLRANQYSREHTADEVMALAAQMLDERMGRSLGAPTTIPLSSVEPVDVEWVWPGVIPRGKLSTFAGPGGLGKTCVSLDLAARISVGGEIPGQGGARFEPGSVLFISAEDDPADTLVPRLKAAGADLDKIHVLGVAAHGRFSLADIATLTRSAQSIGDLSLIVIDPPTAYLGQTDDHKNSELRALLAPLATFAAKQNLAVLLVTHVSKSTSNRASDRILGSVAYTNAVRSAWLFKKDDDDKGRVLILPVKTNLAERATGFAYRIESTLVEGLRTSQGRVAWEAEAVDMDADEACGAESQSAKSPRGKAPTKSTNDAKWLKQFLDDRPPTFLAKIIDAARTDGILTGKSLSPLYNAKDAIPKVFPGHSIEEIEEPRMKGRSLKSWHLIRNKDQSA